MVRFLTRGTDLPLLQGFRAALGPTKPPKPSVPGIFSKRIKGQRGQCDPTASCSAEVRNERICHSTPLYTFMACARKNIFRILPAIALVCYFILLLHVVTSYCNFMLLLRIVTSCCYFVLLLHAVT
jgi:hypothetical protein